MANGYMATDLHWLSIAAAARLIERRELSPVDLVDACLSRVEALDGRLNAFITVLAGEARAAAREAADEIANGGYRGPLHGIPVALKDIFAVAGAPMTAASRIFGDAVSEEDSEVTRRLRAAGAGGCPACGKARGSGSSSPGWLSRPPWQSYCGGRDRAARGP